MIEDFGARGDGRTDDSKAFERALAVTGAGGVLVLGGGREYRLTRSLIFTRPLVIVGGAKDNTRLLFDNGSYAQLGGLAAALIFPHEGGTNPIVSARRSQLSGFTVAWIGESTDVVHGCLISAPVYLSEVNAQGFPGNGFHVEAGSAQIKGNANGTSLINCAAQANRKSGFYFLGNDANACLLMGSRSFDNFDHGFHDESFLGNTYVSCEVDGNQKSGYTSLRTTPNRSVFVGCYAEPNQRYDLNERNLVVGSLGHLNGVGGAALRALPSGDLFSRTGQVYAAEENAAASMDSAPVDAMRVSSAGIDIHHRDGQRIRIAKLLSDNYVDILNGNYALMRMPAKAVTGNVDQSRPWLPGGLTIGSRGRSSIVGAGSKPPADGEFSPGAIYLSDTPAVGGYVGWVCVKAGAPGEWRPFGRIED